jgi:hypothetical protein
MKLWATILALLLPAVAFAGTGKIRGVLLDQSGVPVQHMRVEAFPLDRYGKWSNGTYTITTNHRGQFVIVVSVSESFGYRWRVYPLEEDRYYPDLTARFYQTDENHGKIVQLGNPIASHCATATRTQGWCAEAESHRCQYGCPAEVDSDEKAQAVLQCA